MTSIRLRLLKWLVAPILVFNLLAASLTYLLAWTPAQLAFDQGLLDAATGLAARLRPDGGVVQADVPGAAARVLGAGSPDASWFVVRDTGGRVLAGDAAFPRREDGAQVRDASMHGQPVRVASLLVTTSGGPVEVGVARTLSQRQQVRAAIVRALVLLEVLFSLALVGLVWFSVGNGLAPLARLRARLDARGSSDLAPLDDAGMPRELAPLVTAFNALLGRIAAGARAQDDFRANVAHQLRTPLAGLRLQLEWLATRHRDDPDTQRTVELLLRANERMIRQANQLLSLERAGPDRFERAQLAPLDLAAIVTEAVQSFVEQAASKDIDLGFELASARVVGERYMLRDLVDNLVDNALRYTPEHGTVTVHCRPTPDGALFAVEDSGPGIPPEQRGQVFQRFVRLDQHSTGSGLGLAIVRDIADAHGAEVALSSGPDGTGSTFTVRFP
ncbi:sensor histidine kinase [Massilia yuzhufengensis]|uniref:histidine kinase n=1 Tax=Massilia yuzhufengensis TaxID=1164594 RepID=A0A1I1JDN7_9BURK|nr:sensor histidine kinase [Massilia yuzhufengensis]SFC46465.1 two-component system, OmpR family, sensor histidine kinase TctE [Massilia yuzhufengensis]